MLNSGAKLLKTAPSWSKIVNNNETGDKEFFCDFCKKSFSRKYNLIRHLKLNRCVKLKDIENENIILKKENEEFKKEIDVIKISIIRCNE